MSLLLATAASVGAVTANLDATEANDTLSGAAAVLVQVSAALTENADSLVAATSLIVGLSLAATEADDAISSSALVTISASLTVTESDDGLSSAASVAITLALAATEADDSVTGAASVAIAISAALSENDDILTAEINISIVGDLAATEADDALSATVSIAAGGITASLNVLEADDTLGAAALVSSRLPQFSYRIVARSYTFSNRTGSAVVKAPGEILVPLLFDGRGKVGTPQIVLTSPEGNHVVSSARAIVTLGTRTRRDMFPGSYLRVVALENLLQRPGVYKIRGNIGSWYGPEMFFRAA